MVLIFYLGPIPNQISWIRPRIAYAISRGGPKFCDYIDESEEQNASEHLSLFVVVCLLLFFCWFLMMGVGLSMEGGSGVLPPSKPL